MGQDIEYERHLDTWAGFWAARDIRLQPPRIRTGRAQLHRRSITE